MVAGGLGAVFAIFTATSTSPVDDGAKIDKISAEMLLQFAGAIQHLFQVRR